MNQPLLALIAVLCNVAAQFAMKFAGRGLEEQSGIAAWITPWILIAASLYGISFLLTIRVFAANPLTLASPVMAGGTFLLIALFGSLLGENIRLATIAGMLFILGGIILLTSSHKL